MLVVLSGYCCELTYANLKSIMNDAKLAIIQLISHR